VVGGVLGGSGSVASGIDVTGGVLQPGLSSDEAARITDVPVTAGNTLAVGGDATIGRAGRLAVTISGDRDYTSVRAAGALALAGELDLDVRGRLTPGTVLTIMSGSSISGSFHALPENRVLNAGGHLFRVSYQNNSVTLTVLRGLPG
jgi:subtilase-type serine protease